MPDEGDNPASSEDQGAGIPPLRDRGAGWNFGWRRHNICLTEAGKRGAIIAEFQAGEWISPSDVSGISKDVLC